VEKPISSRQRRVFGMETAGIRFGRPRKAFWAGWMVLSIGLTSTALPAREKDATQYGAGLIVNVPFPESEVTHVVQEVIQNGIIRGTKEYNKDEYVTGATSVSATQVFPEWTEGGKVFYKVRFKALDPRNFKDGSDVGTLAVRYVVQPQDDKHTVLRIDARFVEDFRHVLHLSNGSVEGAEYKDIHDHLDSIELMKAETAEAERDKRAQASRTQNAPAQDVSGQSSSSSQTSSYANTSAVAPSSDTPPPTNAKNEPPVAAKTLEEQVHDLRQQVQRLVKSPGAPLKSAPFHTATTLQTLASGTEVLVVISTPYWLGVETHEGQHGWILRDELEQIP